PTAAILQVHVPIPALREVRETVGKGFAHPFPQVFHVARLLHRKAVNFIRLRGQGAIHVSRPATDGQKVYRSSVGMPAIVHDAEEGVTYVTRITEPVRLFHHEQEIADVPDGLADVLEVVLE